MKICSASSRQVSRRLFRCHLRCRSSPSIISSACTPHWNWAPVQWTDAVVAVAQPARSPLAWRTHGETAASGGACDRSAHHVCLRGPRAPEPDHADRVAHALQCRSEILLVFPHDDVASLGDHGSEAALKFANRACRQLATELQALWTAPYAAHTSAAGPR